MVQKWRNINISDRNARLNHISDKLALDPRPLMKTDNNDLSIAFLRSMGTKISILNLDDLEEHHMRLYKILLIFCILDVLNVCVMIFESLWYCMINYCYIYCVTVFLIISCLLLAFLDDIYKSVATMTNKLITSHQILV